MKKFYFSEFEYRRPAAFITDNKMRTCLFQVFGILTIVVGLAYLHWRWTKSINLDALWFSIPLVVAETLSFIGTLLVIINYWSNKDPEKKAPVHYLSDIEEVEEGMDRPVKIDVFIATYNEDVEMVRYSIRDARQMTYPYPDVKVQVYVLDDGRRDGTNPEKENMRQVALEEGVFYLNRPDNIGYKAGNLKNALEETDGDLFVILDADTRPFSSFLENTTGYFRNHKLAWVQTPQWFYDLTDPQPLSEVLDRKGRLGQTLFGKLLKAGLDKIKIGQDIFGNDSAIFYDVIQRRRNNYNASFCCGAGSIHRREALVSLSLRDFANELRKELGKASVTKATRKAGRTLDISWLNKKILDKQLIPFKFHASEDIYTSIQLHADKNHRWESIMHPEVECKMLSPQDLETWIKQRARYAEGSLDICFRDNPLFKKGLSFGQKLSYLNTMWSYFSPIWITIFLVSPIVFYFTLASPVKAFNFDFFKYFLVFQVLNTISMTLGCWGISTKRGDQYYVASFWVMLMSLWGAVRGKKVEFNVTAKQRQSGNYLRYVMPHLVIAGLTLAGIIYNAVLIYLDMHPTWSGFFTNTYWGLFNIYNLSIMVRAAFWQPSASKQADAVLTQETEQNILQVA